MCGRSACTLAPEVYQRTVSKELNKEIKEWKDKEKYHPIYNAAPTTQLPVVYYVTNTQIKQEIKEEPKHFEHAKKEIKQEVTEEPPKLIQPASEVFKEEKTIIIKEEPKTHSNATIIQTMRWGLIPSYSKDPSSEYMMHNARGETILQKNVFKRLVKRNRCVAFVDGFYEWKRNEPVKQPHFVKHKSKPLLCIAGLYDTWTNKETGEVVNSFTLITTPPPEDFAWLHDRTPLILHDEKEIDIWLDTEKYSLEEAYKLVKPAAKGILKIYRVSSIVNNSKNNSPKCIEPIDSKKGTLWNYFSKKPKQEKKDEKIDEKKKDEEKKNEEKKEDEKKDEKKKDEKKDEEKRGIKRKASDEEEGPLKKKKIL